MTNIENAESPGGLQNITSVIPINHVGVIFLCCSRGVYRNDPQGIVNYLHEEQPLEIRKMITTNLSKGNLHIENLVDTRSQLADSLTLPMDRKHSDLTAGSSLELAPNIANFVIVECIGWFHVRNRPHVYCTGQSHLVGVFFRDRFHCLRAPCIQSSLRNFAEVLLYFVVCFDSLWIGIALDLGNDVSGPNHNHVMIAREWEDMTPKLALDAHRIGEYTVIHDRRTSNRFFLIDFYIAGNLCCTEYTSFRRRFNFFVTVVKGVHGSRRRCVEKGEIVS